MKNSSFFDFLILFFDHQSVDEGIKRMEKKEIGYLVALTVLFVGLAGCNQSKCGRTARQDCIRQSSNYSALLNCFAKLEGEPQDNEGKNTGSEIGYPTTLSR